MQVGDLVMRKIQIGNREVVWFLQINQNLGNSAKNFPIFLANTVVDMDGLYCGVTEPKAIIQRAAWRRYEDR